MSNTPHDTVVKAILGEPKHAVAALRAMVPAALRDALDWSGLRRESASYVSVDGGARHSELLFAVPLRAARRARRKDALIYVLLEHQSTPDPLMALRLFVYVARLFEERVLRAGRRSALRSCPSSRISCGDEGRQSRGYPEGHRVAALRGKGGHRERVRQHASGMAGRV